MFSFLTTTVSPPICMSCLDWFMSCIFLEYEYKFNLGNMSTRSFMFRKATWRYFSVCMCVFCHAFAGYSKHIL